MIDFDNLRKMIDERYISVQKHPSEDLWIYNYTEKAQYDHLWNTETLQCRGLIMDKDNNIVSRPFPKFFNLQEVINQGGQIPAEDFVVTEKMDGSLGITYFDQDGHPHLATRGSFISEQSARGQEILRNKYLSLNFNPTYTYLFEIIYPQNRIVVDYGDMEDLVLLAIVDTHTGEEFPYEKLLEWYEDKIPVVKKYDGIKDLTRIEARPNSEGYVIAFPSSKQRFKIKFDEYVRLHRLITGVNAKRIWDILRNNESLDELLERVPDEFYSWVKKTKDGLELEYNKWENAAREVYSRAIKMPTRKEQAILVKDQNCRSIVFAMLDGKPHGEIIWKMLKPKHETPFKIEI